ncbi:MAG: hypothetical protein K0S33_558 [Bacteroidetes bacterium]|jgi:hypothetical protein|nr:hypothetical protein [Bacteroidota bacterium]
MKKLLFILITAVSLLTACNSEEHGNAPAGDIEGSTEPIDVDSNNINKDTALFPH